MYIVKFPILNDDGDGLCLSWKNGAGHSAYYGTNYALLFSTEEQAQKAISSGDKTPANPSYS